MISQKAIHELASKLSGYVLEPGNADYIEATQIDNGRIQRRPALIVRPTSENDIVLAMRFAIKHEITLTIKGGGHSAAGYCLNDDGLVLDMIFLNAITLNPQKPSVTVQMGARWRDVYTFLAARGNLIPIGGGCPTVGPAGFMQGGGYSFASRSYGMSIDNLLALTIVTPDGVLHKIGVDSKSAYDQDLFWACRGGGGGNFGIVIDMEMLVHQPNTPKMLVGQITFPLAQAEEVMSFYNEWVERLPNEMAVYGRWGQQKDPVNTTKSVKVVQLTPVFNGPFADGIDLLQDVLKLAPIDADLRNMTLPDWELFNGTTTLVRNRSAYIRSLTLPPHGMSAKVVKIFVDYIDKAPSPDSFVVWTHGGGAISNKTNQDTAFAHREARFIPEIKSIWDLDKPGDARKNVEWAYNFFEELTPHATGAYVNYIDPLLHNWPEMYYGKNYSRLQKIKDTVDPKKLFQFQQSIGSEFNPPPAPLTDLSPLNRTIWDPSK